MKNERDKFCPVCDKEYEEIIADGIKSHAICKDEDHYVRHEWHMFHYGGLRSPTFVTTNIFVTFSTESISIDYGLDEPETIHILNQGMYNIVNRYYSIKVPANNLTIDFKNLPRLMKVIKEHHVFI